MVSLEYAKALYSSLNSLKEKEEMNLNLMDTVKIFDNDVSKFFLHPSVNKDNKKEIINKSFKDSILKDFLFVLVDNDRLNILLDISDDFNKLLLEEKNNSKVIVYSKELLDSNYLKSLKEKMEIKLGKEIELSNEIDSSIIAGIRICYDSKELDLTLNSKIDSLTSLLKE